MNMQQADKHFSIAVVFAFLSLGLAIGSSYAEKQTTLKEESKKEFCLHSLFDKSYVSDMALCGAYYANKQDRLAEAKRIEKTVEVVLPEEPQIELHTKPKSCKSCQSARKDQSRKPIHKKRKIRRSKKQ